MNGHDLDSKAMKRRVIGSLAAALAALVVAGCGSSQQEIPSADAEALLSELDSLETQISGGDCVDADSTLNTLFSSAGKLPGGDVKNGVEELLQNLDGLVTKKCGSETTTSSTTTTTTSSTETEPTTTETSTTETSTETKPTTTTETTTTETEPTTTVPGGGQGGGTGGTPPGSEGGGG